MSAQAWLLEREFGVVLEGGCRVLALDQAHSVRRKGEVIIGDRDFVRPRGDRRPKRCYREGGCGAVFVDSERHTTLGIQPRVKSLRSSYTGLYPQTVILHGVVSPEQVLVPG